MPDLLRRAPSRSVTASILPAGEVRHSGTAPVLVGLLGLLISLLFIGTPSVWYDEAATITSATRSLPELWAMVQNVDAVHAVYYLGMHLVFDVVGYSPTALRVPSAVATGMAAAMTVVLGRLVLHPRAALLGGVVFCLLPRVTWMGAEGRSYALSAMLAALLTVVFVHASRSRRRRWWVLYSAVAVVSTLVFIYLALVIAAHGVTAASMAMRSRHGRNSGLPARPGPPTSSPGPSAAFARWFLAATGAGALLLPFAFAVLAQSGQLHWVDPIDEETLREVLQSQWFHVNLEFAVAGWALLLFGTVVLLVRSRPAAVVLLPLIAVPTAILLLVTLAYTPIYTPRYLTMCLPMVALVIGAAVWSLPTRPIIVLTLASLVVISVPSIVAQRQSAAKENTSWEKVSGLIQDQRARDGADKSTAIIYGWVRHHPTATSRVIAYAYPDAFDGTTDVLLDVPAAETGQLWETRAPLASRLPVVQQADVAYLITSTKRDLRPDTTAALAGIGWEPTEEWTIRDVNVVRYQPTDAEAPVTP